MNKFVLPQSYEWDISTEVLIVGGGPAGCCAAIAAARQGTQVLLIEENGFSGGMATAGLVGPFMTSYDKSGENMIIRGLFQELVERLVERGGAIHPENVRAGTAYTSWIVKGHDHVTPFDAEILKKLLDDMLTEAGVKILYHTSFIQAVMDGNRITGIAAACPEGIKLIGAQAVIDCTGDGDVAYHAGANFSKGDGQGFTQPASMFFRINNVDSARLEADMEKNRHLCYSKDGVNYRAFHWYISKAREAGEWSLNRASMGMYRCVKEDEWAINTSRVLNVDATNAESLTAGEIEGRRQVETVMKFMHKYLPGCEDARLMASGSSLGIRESRHIVGEYVLSRQDVIQGRVTEDAILLCANSVDVHGRFGSMSSEYVTVEKGEYYGIPYRCLVPKGIEGLLVAGRCLSADSEAAGAVRVMPPCMGMGQAAGTAAALAVKEGLELRAVNIKELRETLKQSGAYL